MTLARHLARGPLDQDALAADFAAWATHDDTADVGTQTRTVLGDVAAGARWQDAVGRLGNDAGNGSLMRTAPAALAAGTADAAAHLGRRQSEVTHPNRWCVDACGVFSALVRSVLDTGALPPLREVAAWATEAEVREAVLAAERSAAPRMSGFVLHTLTGALWAVYPADNFADAVWRAVGLGHDADTVGAVAGALAGARFGRAAIPEALASKVTSKHPLFEGDWPADLERLAEQLVARSSDPQSVPSSAT